MDISQEAKDFIAIEDVLHKQREQRESMKGKETPFRAVFKTRCGWAYTYHETYEDAQKSKYSSCHYSPFGGPEIVAGRLIRVEKEGPRGAWSKYSPPD